MSPPLFPDSSDDEECIHDYQAIAHKLSQLEREHMLAREHANQYASALTRRTAREERRAEIRQIGETLMSRISVLEAERATTSSPAAADRRATVPGPLASPMVGGSGIFEPMGAVPGPSRPEVIQSPWNIMLPGQLEGVQMRGTPNVPVGEWLPANSLVGSTHIWPWGAMGPTGPLQTRVNVQGMVPPMQPRVDRGIHRPWVSEGPQWPPTPVMQKESRLAEAPEKEPQVATTEPPARTSKPISFGSHISQETIDKIV